MSTLYTESAGGIITNGNNEVVLVSQHGTSWSLPKGHVEAGEDLMQTAYREIHEETGIESLTLIKKVGSYVRPRLETNGNPSVKEIKTIHLYLFTTTVMELKPIDPDNPEAIWVKMDDVVSYLTHENDKKFFESYMNGRINQ